MPKVLVTGMSGTGKSTALADLARRGFEVVDTDEAPWSEWSEEDGGRVWRDDLIEELLSRDRRATLFVSGTVSNQGRFYSRFDAVVLLSARGVHKLDLPCKDADAATTADVTAC